MFSSTDFSPLFRLQLSALRHLWTLGSSRLSANHHDLHRWSVLLCLTPLSFSVVASPSPDSSPFADLVLVLDALFYTQSQRPTGQPITSEEVKDVIKLYEHGKKKEAGAGVFRRDLVHAKLGKANISTFNVSFFSTLSSRDRGSCWSSGDRKPGLEYRRVWKGTQLTLFVFFVCANPRSGRV